MKRTKKGFTLAELLVVVAIIAILVAVAIPVFSGSLEKAREATDAANIRAAYAQLTVEYLEKGLAIPEGTAAYVVKLVQTEAGWQNAPDFPDNLTEANATAAKPFVKGQAKLYCNANGAVSVAYYNEAGSNS